MNFAIAKPINTCGVKSIVKSMIIQEYGKIKWRKTNYKNPMISKPPKKSLGQNFLIDEDILKIFVAAANLNKEDTVIEVGSGTGIVTRELAKIAKKVFAVEIDQDLLDTLKNNIKTCSNAEIINKDILDVFEKLSTNVSVYKIVGAIPYSITSPLLHTLILAKNAPNSITLITQEEVAEKICTKEPKATYLSNFISLYGYSKIVGRVKPTAFYPSPNVTSAIIHIEKRAVVDSADLLRKKSSFLHKGFSHPRKMLGNILEKGILLKAGIDPTSRAQELSLDKWEILFNNESGKR